MATGCSTDSDIFCLSSVRLTSDCAIT